MIHTKQESTSVKQAMNKYRAAFEWANEYDWYPIDAPDDAIYYIGIDQKKSRIPYVLMFNDAGELIAESML